MWWRAAAAVLLLAGAGGLGLAGLSLTADGPGALEATSSPAEGAVPVAAGQAGPEAGATGEPSAEPTLHLGHPAPAGALAEPSGGGAVRASGDGAVLASGFRPEVPQLAPVCVDDPDMRGMYALALVVHPESGPVPYDAAQVRATLRQANWAYHQPAQAAGVDVRLRVHCEAGTITVLDLGPAPVASPTMEDMRAMLHAAGHLSDQTRYLVYYAGGPFDCGGMLCIGNADVPWGDAPSREARAAGNEFAMAAMSDLDASNWLHEWGHTMGAVAASAPSSDGYHCTDNHDTLCPWISAPCPGSTLGNLTWDCHRDDYANAAPAETGATSYLHEHWNLAVAVNPYAFVAGGPTLTGSFPASSAPLTVGPLLTATWPRGSGHIEVDWGDGDRTRLPPSGTTTATSFTTLSHTYDAPGRYHVVATAWDDHQVASVPAETWFAAWDPSLPESHPAMVVAHQPFLHAPLFQSDGVLVGDHVALTNQEPFRTNSGADTVPPGLGLYTIPGSGGWTSKASWGLADGYAKTNLGASVDRDGDRVAVSAPSAPGTQGPGAVFVHRLVDGALVLEGRVERGTSTAATDGFGRQATATARAVSLSGDRLAVAAGASSVAGTVSLFRFSAGAWVPDGTVTRPEFVTSGGAGTWTHEPLLDGDWLAVTAQSGLDSRTFMWHRDPAGWVLKQTLDTSAATGVDQALAFDAGTLVLTQGAGLSVAYTLQGGTWQNLGAFPSGGRVFLDDGRALVGSQLAQLDAGAWTVLGPAAHGITYAASPVAVDVDLDTWRVLYAGYNLDVAGLNDQALFVASLDADRDTVADPVDECPGHDDRVDTDLDGLPDLCEADADHDGIDNALDNCWTTWNPGQENADGGADDEGDVCDTDLDNDTVPDTTDNCPADVNLNQADLDEDGTGDACDDDLDNDGIANDPDNCPATENASQADADLDTQGDACDLDADNDGIPNTADNCDLTPNTSQADRDNDASGDACDDDNDNDGTPDDLDNCPADPNADQRDQDRDGQGDACDPDDDGDGVGDPLDRCPGSDDAKDEDADGEPDGCDAVDDRDDDGDRVPNTLDRCPGHDDRANIDRDPLPDACDPDHDNDTVPDAADQCRSHDDHADADLDGSADGCDLDDDNDGVGDPQDTCPGADSVADLDGDGVPDGCDPDDDGDGVLDAGDPCRGGPAACRAATARTLIFEEGGAPPQGSPSDGAGPCDGCEPLPCGADCVACDGCTEPGPCGTCDAPAACEGCASATSRDDAARAPGPESPASAPRNLGEPPVWTWWLVAAVGIAALLAALVAGRGRR